MLRSKRIEYSMQQQRPQYETETQKAVVPVRIRREQGIAEGKSEHTPKKEGIAIAAQTSRLLISRRFTPKNRCNP